MVTMLLCSGAEGRGSQFGGRSGAFTPPMGVLEIVEGSGFRSRRGLFPSLGQYWQIGSGPNPGPGRRTILLVTRDFLNELSCRHEHIKGGILQDGNKEGPTWVFPFKAPSDDVEQLRDGGVGRGSAFELDEGQHNRAKRRDFTIPHIEDHLLFAVWHDGLSEEARLDHPCRVAGPGSQQQNELLKGQLRVACRLEVRRK